MTYDVQEQNFYSQALIYANNSILLADMSLSSIFYAKEIYFSISKLQMSSVHSRTLKEKRWLYWKISSLKICSMFRLTLVLEPIEYENFFHISRLFYAVE